MSTTITPGPAGMPRALLRARPLENRAVFGQVMGLVAFACLFCAAGTSSGRRTTCATPPSCTCWIEQAAYIVPLDAEDLVSDAHALAGN